jgi:hypothetical protein
MPTASKQEASVTFEAEGLEGRYQAFGGYTIGFETYTTEADHTDLLKGLPDDACQCTHMGMVLSGKIVFTYTDGTQDVITAGEAYVTKSGHTPKIYPGTELIEFTKTDEFDQTMEVVSKNMEAASA